MDPPLTGEVQLHINHSHNTTAATLLRMLRINEEVKKTFYSYFDDGFCPSEAVRYHENIFLMKEDFTSLANASLNPTTRMVYYLYEVWRDEGFGKLDDITPLEKLKEKLQFYESKGAIVRVSTTDPWSVVVATDVMRRVQNLDTSSEMIFIDSTTSCEVTSTSMTVLLTTTKVGALPLAALIHRQETAESYENAFRLLQETFPYCFGGKTYPSIVMTDDSSAEKKALKIVWPGSVQLLCHFHVAQAEWRWLFSNTEIPKDERIRLMRLFQKVMYATTEKSLDEAVENIEKESLKYPLFVNRFKKFYSRKTEWVLFFRQKLLTRKNNTNNYAEASIRILKDVVLCRTKAFNVVALVDFCLSMWEPYLIKRLLEYAHSRRGEVRIVYEQFLKKTERFTIEDISEDLCIVKSGDCDYFINMEFGICSCPSGTSGAFCKHQFWLVQHKKISLPNAPPMTPADRYQLAILALGQKCPPYEFFQDFDKTEDILNDETLDINSNLACLKSAMSQSNNIQQKFSASDVKKNEVKKELERLSTLLDGDIEEVIVNRLLRNLQQIKKPSDLSSLYFLKSKVQKKIRVQPTSGARRRPNITRTTLRIQSGRPSGQFAKKKRRKRDLAENVRQNKPSSKY